MRTIVRFHPIHLSLILLLASLVLLAVAQPCPVTAQEPEQSQAALIIDFGDGSSESFCVPFSGESITGVELFQLAGVEVGMGTTSWGTQVCEVKGVGCQVGREPCFCQCTGGTKCTYWNYYLWQDGKWVYSNVGPGLRNLTDGDADAWVWGDGKTPPTYTPEEVCQPAQQAVQESTPAPAATAEATVPATAEVAPTATPAALAATDTPAPAPTSGQTGATTDGPCSGILALALPLLVVGGVFARRWR